MVSGKSIAWFAVKFLVLYGLLAASWPVVGRAYAGFFRESGELFFGTVGAGDSVRIRAATRPDGLNDTLLLVRNETARRWLPVQPSSWLMGYQPTSLLIALILATPVSKGRRVGALCAGLVIVHLFVLLRLATFVVLAHVEMSDTLLMEFFRWCTFDFMHGHGVSCVVPVVVWLAVSMRREDVSRLFPSKDQVCHACA